MGKNALKCAMELGCSKKMRLFESDSFLGDTKVFSCNCRVIFGLVYLLVLFDSLTSPNRSFSFWLKRHSETFSEVIL